MDVLLPLGLKVNWRACCRLGRPTTLQLESSVRKGGIFSQLAGQEIRKIYFSGFSGLASIGARF
jgi:hypothetical protein